MSTPAPTPLPSPDRGPSPRYDPQPCFRCRRLAEMPLHAEGRAGGEALDNAPLCGDCLSLCINDPEAFWAPLRRRQQERQQNRRAGGAG